MKSFIVNDEIHKEFKDFCKSLDRDINKSVEKVLREFLDIQKDFSKRKQQTGYLQGKFVKLK